MLAKFEPEEIQYYAGLVDGDGAIGWNSWHSKTIRMQIEFNRRSRRTY